MGNKKLGVGEVVREITDIYVSAGKAAQFESHLFEFFKRNMLRAHSGGCRYYSQRTIVRLIFPFKSLDLYERCIEDYRRVYVEDGKWIRG